MVNASQSTPNLLGEVNADAAALAEATIIAREDAFAKVKDRKLRSLKKQYAKSGANYFSKSQVGSSQGFFSTAGIMLAIPYKSKAAKGQNISANNKLVGKSEYGSKFTEKRFEYSSMDNKPLTTYDPLAYRSRNAQSEFTVPDKNSSVIEFTSADYRKKRRFVTTNMTSYEGLPCATVSNAGILAEDYKIKCGQRAK